MRINTFHGRSIRFTNGFSIGFNWIHGNGQTSKRAAVIASYHHPRSITWRWGLDWVRPQHIQLLPKLTYDNNQYGHVYLQLPLVGALLLRWQPHMMRKQKGGAA